MLRDVPQPARLLHFDPDVLPAIAAALHDDWRAEALTLLADGNWRGHVIACAAMLVAGSTGELDAAIWQTLDQGSWSAPQLVATAFFVEPQFDRHAEERLLSSMRRSPKAIAALVRAYHRLPKPRMNVVAQLGRYDALLNVEEGRIGIRAVDGWLDRLPQLCDATMQARWRRQPRALAI